MNREAEKHLDKAEGYLGKGEEWYRKAAAEIAAARESDPDLSYREIGRRIGFDERWVRRLLAWDSGSGTAPFVGRSEGDDFRGRSEVRKAFRDAPMEQVERIIEELPAERKTAIAAAAGLPSAKARQEYEERERQMTPAARKEREAAVASVDTAAARATAGFDAFGIANYLRQATDVLREMIEESTITPEMMSQIDAALASFLDEYRVAQAKTGREVSA